MISQFQGSFSAWLQTTISGYAAPGINWSFCGGNPWPVNSVTHLNTFFGQVNAFRVDVFDVATGAGRVTSFVAQTGAGATSGTNTPFGWWNNRITGMAAGFYSGPPSGNLNGYDSFNRAAVLGNGWTIPFLGNTKRLLSAGPGTPQYRWGGGVFMPKFNRAAVTCALGNSGLDVGFVFDDGTDIGSLDNFESRTMWGTVPGSNLFCETFGSGPGLAFFNGTSLSDIPLSWDNASVETFMAANWGQFTKTLSNGWLDWHSFAANGNFVDNFGVSHGNCLILTSTDGSKYWIIDLLPADANAAIALGSNDGLASAHMTPDGIVWFQSTTTVGVSGLVFTNLVTQNFAPVRTAQLFPPARLPLNAPDVYETVGTFRSR